MSERFHLAVGDVIQGDMSLCTRTLLLVFQVNCPGCFTYALPLAEAIHNQANRLGIAVKALSTAFEDFDLNTVENTRALVEDGTLVGETKGALGRDSYEGSISFPVAVDAGIERGMGETFITNQLRGTPSWLVLEADGTLLASHFGQLPVQVKSSGFGSTLTR